MNDDRIRQESLESWDGGAAYEAYMARWSQRVAREFLAWLAVPADRLWLDVGCGTGGLSRTILEHANPESVQGIDPSEHFVTYAQAHTADQRSSFSVGRAEALPVSDESFDAVVSGLVLNFVPPPLRSTAISEMVRVARAGGTVAAYVWDYLDGMQLMRYFWDAVAVLDPNGKELDEGHRFEFCRPEPLTRMFRDADLNDVRVRPIDIPTPFRDFDDYWLPFLGGQGSAPTYAVSLTDERRTTLRDYLQAKLPVESDGSIQLTARAWAVRGTV